MNKTLISLMNAAPFCRRLVAGTILLVIIILVVMLLMMAISRLSGMRDDIQALREERFQIQTAISRARLQTAKPLPQTDGNPLLIAGASLSVVQANLYQLLNQTAQTSGAAITSISSMPSQQRAGLNYVGIRMDIEGTISAVHETIQRIESMVPALIVEKVQLRAISAINGDELSAPVSVAGQLNVLGALDPSVTPIQSEVQ